VSDERLSPLPASGIPPGAVPVRAYADIIGGRIQVSHYDLATRWLERLVALLPVDPQAVFATHLLLDHIPGLIQEIGKYVASPADEDIASKGMVVDKARELGQLRHQQRASLHQVLREYDLLAEILDQFVIDETRALAGAVTAVESLEVSRRANRAVRVLMQITAQTFIAQYTETITEQADRLDRFNRAVSHELRNVLGTLYFGVELIADPGIAESVPRRTPIVDGLRRNCQRAIKIIRSFERLPRSGILSDSPSEQVVELGELVREVFRQLDEMAAARQVSLRAAGTFPRVYLDSGALELVLINLVSNAIKYSDPDKPERHVEVSVADVDSTVELQVADNGLGIPEGALDRVFERFTRAHADLDPQLGVEGTGLGLSIVEECVKSLGGRIAVQSQEKVGTRFTITVPKKLPPLAVS
jgi:signal transduction histidine kinase